MDDIVAHASRFIVAELDQPRDRMRGARAAERHGRRGSFARCRSTRARQPHRTAPGDGAGQSRAAARGFATLCAFTHQPSHFVKMGFTIVPHMWVPEKIAHDCTSCPLFRRCGQYAVTLPLRAGVQIRPEQPAAVIYAGRSVAARATECRTPSARSCPVFAELTTRGAGMTGVLGSVD